MKDIVDADGNVILYERDFLLLVKFLRNIKFGSVTLTIREGEVVGIEKNEKIRLE